MWRSSCECVKCCKFSCMIGVCRNDRNMCVFLMTCSIWSLSQSVFILHLIFLMLSSTLLWQPPSSQQHIKNNFGEIRSKDFQYLTHMHTANGETQTHCYLFHTQIINMINPAYIQLLELYGLEPSLLRFVNLKSVSARRHIFSCNSAVTLSFLHWFKNVFCNILLF